VDSKHICDAVNHALQFSSKFACSNFTYYYYYDDDDDGGNSKCDGGKSVNEC
jgi:hypothetical protein